MSPFAARGYSRRDAASLYMLVCFAATVVFLLAGYWSASTERLALRVHEKYMTERIRSDARSITVLLNFTHSLNRRVRDAKGRVLRLTKDNDDLKTSVNREKKISLRTKKQRNALLSERHNLRKAVSMLKNQKDIHVAGLPELDTVEMYDGDNSSEM